MKLPVLSKTTEPILLAHYAAAAIGYVLTFLVEHGVIGTDEASTALQVLVPAAVGAGITGLGFVTRSFVTPLVKLVANSAPVREIEKLVGDVANVTNPPAVIAAPAPVAAPDPAPVAPVSVATNDVPVVTPVA